MNRDLISDAIGNIDGDLIESYFKTEEKLAKKRAKRGGVYIIRAAVAACLLLAFLAVAIPWYMPAELPLDYVIYIPAGEIDTGGIHSPGGSYGGIDGGESIRKENVWVYYVQDGEIRRIWVRIPRGEQNAFIAWKHLNGIEEDIQLRDCDTRGKALDIMLSAPLPQENDMLVYSLEKTLCAYFGTEFEEINISITKRE